MPDEKQGNTKKTEKVSVKSKAEPTKSAKEKKEEEKKPAESKEKPETAKAKSEKPSGVKISPKLERLIKGIEELSVIELSDLVKALQEKFGVTAIAPTPAIAPSPTGPALTTGAPAAEQTTFNVILSESGPNKISVIKTVKELVPDLGLKEAKDLVESAPKQVLSGANKEKAEEAKKKLEEAGAKVELK